MKRRTRLALFCLSVLSLVALGAGAAVSDEGEARAETAATDSLIWG